jgi:hypothetical protein
MGADEKFVRDNWAHVRSWVRDLDSYGTDQFNVALFLNAKDAKWRNNPFQGWQEDYGKEDAVWSSAAEFTRSRLEEIRQLRAEIDRWTPDVDQSSEDWREWAHERAPSADQNYVREAICGHCRDVRTLARLQAALAELKRGMTAGG